VSGESGPEGSDYETPGLEGSVSRSEPQARFKRTRWRATIASTALVLIGATTIATFGLVGGAAEDPSVASWSEDANEVCQDSLTELRRNTGSTPTAQEGLEGAIPVVDEMIFRLRLLKPPSKEESRFGLMIDAWNQFAQNAKRAVDAGPNEQASTSLSSARDALAEASGLADDLSLRDCARVAKEISLAIRP